MPDDVRKDEPETEKQEQAEEPQPQPEPERTEETVEEPAAQQSEEEQQPAPEIDVFDILRMSIGMFIQEAWIGMGVQARPGGSETSVNLRDARVAIDVIEALAGKLAEHGDADEKRTMDQVLTDLRVNFVRISNKIGETT